MAKKHDNSPQPSLAEACDLVVRKLQDKLIQHHNEFKPYQHPIHLDLFLAAQQLEIYKKLLEVQNPDSTGPYIRVVAGHYFAYDRTRITKISSDKKWMAEERLPSIYNVPKNAGALLEDHIQPFDHLLMLAYRQLFQEKRTLNAWLLRTADQNTPYTEDARFGLQISDDPAPNHRFTSVPSKIARSLVPDKLIRELTKVVIPLAREQSAADGASERIRIAAKLYKEISTAAYPERYSLQGPTSGIMDSPEYRRIRDSISFQLNLPRWSHSVSFIRSINESVYTMLQSAVFYMRLYGAEAFYSLTTEEAGLPFGVTVLTGQALSHDDLASLHQMVNIIGNRQHSAVGAAMSSSNRPMIRHRLPEQVAGESLSLRIRGNGRGRKLWDYIRDRQNIPAWALATLIRLIEQSADCEIEHRFPRTAFVLSQSSYLESVGLVNIKKPEPKPNQPSFLHLVYDNPQHEDRLIEMANNYELKRWEAGRGILPYDVVANVKGQSSEEIPRDLTVKKYLTDKWGFPEPSDGFHLIDLDAHFIYPAVGIEFVKRASLGCIGWFQEGSPPAGDLGHRAYFALSQTRHIRRFVAGVTNGTGDAVLITEGRVCAVYRRKAWEFYDRDYAKIQLGSVAGVKKELASDVLEAAERLSHTHRKGALFVLSDCDPDEWMSSGARRKYFVRMIDPSTDIPINVADTEAFVSLAQMDGCCVIGKNGELLGYGYKICVSAEQVFLGLTEDAFKEEEQTLRGTIGQPGTRRWSSALLSKVTKWPIVNISSDGPVTLFVDGRLIKIYPSSPELSEKEVEDAKRKEAELELTHSRKESSDA